MNHQVSNLASKQPLTAHSLNFNIYKYSELTVNQVYQILMARSAVFVVEQNCVYQDIDGIDESCLHIIIDNEKGQLMAYCRIIPNNNIENINIEINTEMDIGIGRVLVMPEYRNQGLAKKLMTYTIEYCHQHCLNNGVKKGVKLSDKQAIKISAQCYLIDFYQSLGFTVISEPYLEDGIEHIDMRLVV